MNPRSPTATKRCPARVTLSMTDWAAIELMIDGCIGKPSVCAEAEVLRNAATTDALNSSAFSG
ncbi:hypothetical protein D3C84_1019820 [compost metagenome]